MRILVCLALLLFAANCTRSTRRAMTVNVSLQNASSNALDWVQFVWAGPPLSGGVMPPGVSKTAVGSEWPSVPSAKITFVDQKSRAPYSLDVDLSGVNKQVAYGKCGHVTVRILGYDKADAICGAPW